MHIKSAFLKKRFVFFNMDYFLNLLLNLLQYCFCFMFWPQGMWDLNSQTSDQTCTPALEGEALTTGPLGMSPKGAFYKHLIISHK